MDSNEKTNIKIGIGVTTTPNRKEFAENWIKKFEEVRPDNYHLHIHEDVHYKGVAYSKNQNLKTLQGCDYIFLFDDDCYPIKKGWAEFFINSRQNHLLFLNYKHFLLQRIDYHNYYLETYKDCGGVFMYLTKEAFNKVGYFNSEYGQYGFEHAGYSNRIFKAHLIPWMYQQLENTSDYLMALDYSSKIKSSIPDYKKLKLIEENRKIFINELQSDKIFYNFTE